MTAATPSGSTDPSEAPAARPRPRRRAALALAMLGGVGAVLLGFAAVAGATVAPDGTLTEPFWALALGTLALTAAGTFGLGWLFLGIRRRSACARGRC